jgi:hypothetical protein
MINKPRRATPPTAARDKEVSGRDIIVGAKEGNALRERERERRRALMVNEGFFNYLSTMSCLYHTAPSTPQGKQFRRQGLLVDNIQ